MLQRTFGRNWDYRAKALAFSTLESICKALKCQPGDILKFQEEEQ
ncbi:MAG: helix-turn-helix domain-containing protein [Rhabdochlamydiaceae bacterium]|nr:helix-turn-helix domain-containing protein [Rhabdochlamydiaceae bacterium]